MTPEDKAMRAKARRRVADAVRKGLLVRPLKCECCDSIRHIEAHHSDYAKPLEIRWLARDCHRRLHGRNRLTSSQVEAKLEYNRQRRHVVTERRERRRRVTVYARARLASEAPDRPARRRLAGMLGCTDTHLMNIIRGWSGVGDVLLDALLTHWGLDYQRIVALAEALPAQEAA